MSGPLKPSEEGKKRYEPDGIYDGEFACTCVETCPRPCKGRDGCACDACRIAYMDFLSCDYD